MPGLGLHAPDRVRAGPAARGRRRAGDRDRRPRPRRPASSASGSGIAQTALGDWTILELDLFRPLVPVQHPRRQRARRARGDHQRLRRRRQDVTYADAAGESALEITGMDATVPMNLQEKVMPWPNLPDARHRRRDLRAVRASCRWCSRRRRQLVEPEGTTTQRSTDIRFLRRLAAAQRLRLLRAAGAAVRPRPGLLPAAAARSGLPRRC